MSQDLLKKAEAVIEELDQLVMDEKIFLLHDYYPFMMDEDDIKDVEEMIKAGKNDKWEEYIQEQKRKRELERIEENRKQLEEFKRERERKQKNQEKNQVVEKKKIIYKKLDKPEDYVYSEEEKKKILEHYDKLLKKRRAQLKPGSSVSMIGYGFMNRTRKELLDKNMYRKMDEAILNGFIWIKNHSGWSHSYVK